MKELTAIVIITALLAGASYAAIELGGDRELFVSPPDAVAEGFTREVMTKRYDRARELLAEPESVSRQELEALCARLGDVQNVDAELVSIDGDRAEVRVKLKEQELALQLVWQDREWKVIALPLFGAPPSRRLARRRPAAAPGERAGGTPAGQPARRRRTVRATRNGARPRPGDGARGTA